MLRPREPYPALLMDRAYSRVQTNAGFDRLLSRVDRSTTMWDRTLYRRQPNLLRL